MLCFYDEMKNEATAGFSNETKAQKICSFLSLHQLFILFEIRFYPLGCLTFFARYQYDCTYNDRCKGTEGSRH